MSQLAVSNVVNISVAAAGTGLGSYNTSNLALFTRDAPGSTFGTLSYAIYLSPTQVGVDFGTSSETYAMAVQIFSQQPNILANSGYLVIFPMLTAAQVAAQNIAFSDVAASGAFVLNYGGNSTSSLPYTSSASAIQTALRTLTGLSSVTVTGSIASQDLVVTFTGISGPAALLTVSSNTLANASSVAVTPTVTTTTIGSTAETLDAAIARTQGLVQYFGCMIAEITPQAVMLAAAALVQSLNKILFVVSYTAADIAAGGMLDLLRSGSLSQTRGLYYGTVLADALGFMAAYAGRALSVIFTGSNTTQTMHLKNLVNVQPDPSVNQTVLNQCQTAGVDVYCNIQGLSKVFCSGANTFFDRVYNLQWYIGALQVAIFNVLATTSTKIAQTESGVAVLKAAARQVSEQAVANQYLAPGSWTSPNTFGVLADLISNITQRGYYIYTAPIAQQSAAARASRALPLMQIAAKEAGAAHSASILINVNQ